MVSRNFSCVDVGAEFCADIYMCQGLNMSDESALDWVSRLSLVIIAYVLTPRMAKSSSVTFQ